MQRLENKIALVTGAGQGIGQAMATQFAREGAEVYIADLDETNARTASEQIAEAGGSAHPLVADVTNPDDVAAMYEQIKSKSGHLNILVNNAGIHIRTDFRHADDETVDKVFDVNLRGVIRCAREGFDLLRASENGCIINLSSIMAENHVRQLSIYATTKGGVSSLSRALALEYAPYNLRVNYLLPGFIDTELSKRFTKNPVISKELIDRTPLRRFGTPDDVAKAALYLASDDAAFITGMGLTVDGGVSITV